jgi:hypothetical protein
MFTFGLALVAMGLLITTGFQSSKVQSEDGLEHSVVFVSMRAHTHAHTHMHTHTHMRTIYLASLFLVQVAGAAGSLSTTLASLSAFVLNQDVPPAVRYLLALFPPCAAVQGLQAALKIADSPDGETL